MRTTSQPQRDRFISVKTTLLSTVFVLGAGLTFAPAAQANIRTAKGCATRVAKPGKRKACRACVNRPRPHAFFKMAPAGKRCRPFKLARAKMAPANAPTAIKTLAGCKRRVVKPGKRAACKACITRPVRHGYFKMARPGNRCKRLMAPAAPRRGAVRGAGIRFPKGCNAKVAKPGKRRACLVCVTRPRPHAFFKGAPKGRRCRRVSR